MKASIDYKLFDQVDLGKITLKNRIVMAPLTRSRAIGNVPNELMATYYSQRAGAGLIITEGTSPSPNGIGYPRIPGVYNKAQIDGWKKVTDQVHQMGGKIFLQIMHCGRVVHPENLPEGAEMVAPSAVKLTETKMYVDGEGELPMPAPRAMRIDDIAHAIEEYKQAAVNAMEAGFDGVEIHAANGYLINQFINTSSNKRTDHYGGSVENRTRFAVEVCEAVSRAIGAEKTGIRMSPYGVMNEMGSYDEIDETFMYLATQVNRLGLIYIHLVDHSTMGAPEVPASIKNQIRTVFNNTLILSGGYDKERAEADIVAGRCELVAFGRPYIANPDLAGRFIENARLNVPNSDLFYTPGKEGYVDYPFLKPAEDVQ